MPRESIETNDAPATADNLSSGTRTLISFLLFAHFFALTVAVLSNFGPVSALRNQLSVTFLRSYTGLLHMDIAYNFHLVDASELDAPLSMELDTSTRKDDTSESIVFPDVSSPNIRTGRYRQLMLNVDLMQGDE